MLGMNCQVYPKQYSDRLFSTPIKKFTQFFFHCSSNHDWKYFSMEHLSNPSDVYCFHKSLRIIDAKVDLFQVIVT